MINLVYLLLIGFAVVWLAGKIMAKKNKKRGWEVQKVPLENIIPRAAELAEIAEWAKREGRWKVLKAPIENIRQGPIFHDEGLSPLLEEYARALFSRVGHFFYPSFEQWELSFMRDMHPWREILIWEHIARTFDLYSAKHSDANGEQVVGTIIRISTGQISENESETEKELRQMYVEAYKKQWAAPPGEPFEFPQDQAIVLKYEDIVDEDEWDGSIRPNVQRQVDPRPILAQADIILGQDVKTERFFCLFGMDRLEDGGIPAGLKTLIVSLDPSNEKTQELGKLCGVVKAVKGRKDCW